MSERSALPVAQLRGLRRLASLPRGRAQPVDIEDLVFESMARGVARLAHLSGSGLREVEVIPGMRVKMEMCPEGTWFADRLREIDQLAQSVAHTEEASKEGISLNDVRMRLLRCDGWVVNRRTVKTPPWMEPHQELETSRVATLCRMGWIWEIPAWIEMRRDA